MFDLREYVGKIEEAAAFIRSRHPRAPEVGIICGTGMGELATRVESATIVPYDDIPHFPVSTVESHHGKLFLGRLAGREVFVMQGRFHFYEGWSMREVTFPVRVMKALGCRAMIAMNAVGSMNPLIPVGSYVLVDDHVNLMGDNPLLGPNDEALGPRFPDMSEPYDKRLRAIAREVALAHGVPVKEGVMVAIAGPNLETRAEYRMFQRFGADIVTMSTVPEVLVAVHGGMKVLGISTVTDQCLPDSLRAVDIAEIIEVAHKAEHGLSLLVQGVLRRIGEVLDPA